MLRFLLKLTLIFVFVFAALNISARALGTTQPPNPTLAGFTIGCEGKPQPCWYGIVPGATTMEEAQRLVEEQGYVGIHEDHTTYTDQVSYSNNINSDLYVPITMTSHPDKVVSRVILWRIGRLLFGEVIASLGSPTGIDLRHEPQIILFQSGYVAIFSDSWQINLLDSNSLYSPFNRYILLVSVDDVFPGRPWRGFMPYWRYKQLELDYETPDG